MGFFHCTVLLAGNGVYCGLYIDTVQKQGQVIIIQGSESLYNYGYWPQIYL